MDKDDSKKKYVYPILRVDRFQFAKDRMPKDDEFEQFISITKVMHTEAEAKAEAERLNDINKSKNVLYFYSSSSLHD